MPRDVMRGGRDGTRVEFSQRLVGVRTGWCLVQGQIGCHVKRGIYGTGERAICGRDAHRVAVVVGVDRCLVLVLACHRYRKPASVCWSELNIEAPFCHVGLRLGFSFS